MNTSILDTAGLEYAELKISSFFPYFMLLNVLVVMGITRLCVSLINWMVLSTLFLFQPQFFPQICSSG